MNFKESLNDFKNFINPNKSETITLIHLIILIFFLYYDALLSFPVIESVNIFLMAVIIVYIVLFIVVYVYFRQKIQNVEFKSQFYLFTQMIITNFLGIGICIFYLSVQTNEIIIFGTALIPLIFFILIAGFTTVKPIIVLGFKYL